jgi:hypothetical protein
LQAQSLCDSGSISRRLRPPQSKVQLQFCDDPQIAFTKMAEEHEQIAQAIERRRQQAK